MLENFYRGLETSINRYLQTDPESRERLGAIQNKIIQIDIVDWNCVIYLKVENESLKLSSVSSGKPDVSIQAPLFVLIKLTREKGVFFHPQLKVQGDAVVAQIFRDLIQKAEPDWEEELSRFTGDAVAHKVWFYGKELFDFGRRGLKILRENFKEYFHEELKLFPSTQQAEEFYQNVTAVRDDVERMELRINRLSKKKELQ